MRDSDNPSGSWFSRWVSCRGCITNEEQSERYSRHLRCPVSTFVSLAYEWLSIGEINLILHVSRAISYLWHSRECVEWREASHGHLTHWNLRFRPIARGALLLILFSLFIHQLFSVFRFCKYHISSVRTRNKYEEKWHISQNSCLLCPYLPKRRMVLHFPLFGRKLENWNFLSICSKA